MKITFDQVENFIKVKGYVSRGQRYVAAREFFLEQGFDIPAEMFKSFDTFHRYFRDDKFFPKDGVGEKKEKEWQTTPAGHVHEDTINHEQKQLFKTVIMSV